jgi:adenine-specific DNA-methyltransferase
MAGRKGKPGKSSKKPIEQYEHKGKERANNPPVGLVTPDTDRDSGKKTYAYDPHLDPQLVWAGKAEHTSFEVPTVSLHVHERIDPKTILDAVRKRNGDGSSFQPSLFTTPSENPPLRDAVEFKREFLGEWIEAVNEQGGFGRWACDVSFSPSDLPEILAKHAS